MQIDACRLGGLNEVLAVQLMAAKYGLPVWPHAGGVGLCEYVDHLHEHFTDPCKVRSGAYMAPSQPGFSIRIKEGTLTRFSHPG